MNLNSFLSAKYYNCKWKLCEKTFLTLAELGQHINEDHVKSKEGKFYCNWLGCNRSAVAFNARYKIIVHLRTHTMEKPHLCTECQKCFTRAENLKIHHRTHTGEKPYECSFDGCKKRYSNSSDRFKHLRTHYTEKPYACKFPNCIKSYTDPSSLRKHVKSADHYFKPLDLSNKIRR